MHCTADGWFGELFRMLAQRDDWTELARAGVRLLAFLKFCLQRNAWSNSADDSC